MAPTHDDIGIPWGDPNGDDDIAPYVGDPAGAPLNARAPRFLWGKGSDPKSNICTLARLYNAHKPRKHAKNTPEYHSKLQLIKAGLQAKIPIQFWPIVTVAKFSDKMSCEVKRHSQEMKENVGIAGTNSAFVNMNKSVNSSSPHRLRFIG